MALFALLAFLALGKLPLPFVPCLVRASTSVGWSSCVFTFASRLEGASAPSVIFCGHAQTIEVSKFLRVQSKMCLQWLRRVSHDTCLCFFWIPNGIRTVRFVVSFSPAPEIRSDCVPRPQTLEPNLYVIICTNRPVQPSWSEIPYTRRSCLSASKPLFPNFLTSSVLRLA